VADWLMRIFGYKRACKVHSDVTGFSPFIGGNMAVKIRLKRTGATNNACYRVVAADARSPRDGRKIEILGWYDPKKSGKNFELKMDRVEYWTSQGAQVSDTVRSLLRKAKKAAPAVAEQAPEPVADEPAAED
jgi:small subunit ribosomal protein S16